MAERYSGAWTRRTQTDRQAPLAPPLDPEHTTPTATPEYVDMAPMWVSNVAAPDLPAEMMPDPTPMMPTGWGPVDHTPVDHNFGMGVGAGLSTLEAQDLRGVWHQVDMGAPAAKEWQPAINRDGQPRLEIQYGQQLSGDSPQTLQLERTGIGQPNDPEATARRPSDRQKRWWDRYQGRKTHDPGAIGPSTWDAAYRPQATRNAYSAPPQPPVAGGTQLDSPYATSVTDQPWTQDRFVGGQVRRIPGAWDESMTTDGTVATMAGAPNDYGLPAWGL